MQPQAAPTRTVLHVGCGAKRIDSLPKLYREGGWREIRLDLNPAVKPDILASIVSMPQVADESVDSVFSSHNLEHLFAHEVPTALREFLRVLKPGGFLMATMPDLQVPAEAVAQGRLEEPLYKSPAGPISPIDMFFGHRDSIARGNVFMAHRTGFTADSLRQKLEACGYADVNVRRSGFDLWAAAYKGSRPAAGGGLAVNNPPAVGGN